MNLFFPSNQSYYDDVECVGDSIMDKIERQSPQSQIHVMFYKPIFVISQAPEIRL